MILSIDTSTKVFSACLSENKPEFKIIAEKYYDTGLRHSDLLIKSVDRLLKETGTELAQINKVICSTGPGSFTGIRIGLAFSRTLCQALKIPLVGISTLDTLAGNIGLPDIPVCSIIDALQDEVFVSFYKNNSRIDNYSMYKTDVLINCIRQKYKQYKKIIFTGDAVNIYKSKLQNQLKHYKITPIFPSENKLAPHASVLAKLGNNMPGKKYSLIVPFYIKPPTIR